MDEQTINMIESCLRIDPAQRLTADELLAKDYFEIEFIERFSVIMQSLQIA
jgi:serine/threonine protein kinase